MVRFSNPNDEQLAEALHSASASFELITGGECLEIFSRLSSAFNRCFDIHRLENLGEPPAIRRSGFAVRNPAAVIGFYIHHANELGAPIYAMSELSGLSQPRIVFNLPRASVLAMAHHAYAQDHISFSPQCDFLIVKNHEDMLAGYGRASSLISSFHEAYPELSTWTRELR